MATPMSQVNFDGLTYALSKSKPTGAMPTQNIFVNVGRDPFKFSLTHNTVDCATEEEVRAMPLIARVDPPLSPGQKHSVVLNIPDEHAVKFFDGLDGHNVRMLQANAQAYFKKSPAPSEVERMYKPILRPKTEQYSASLRAKLITDHADERRNTKIYVADGFATPEAPLTYKPGTIADLRAGSFALVILQCSVMWTRDRECGMTFAATEIFVWHDAATSGTGIDAFGWRDPPVFEEEVDA